MKNFFSNFVLRTFKADTPRAQAQIEILDGELHDDVEVLDYYGTASSPPDDIEHGVCAHIHGQEDNSVVLGFIDDKYRPKDLTRGEVVFYASFGQTIKLKKDGSIIIDNGAGAKIEMLGGKITTEATTVIVNATDTTFNGTSLTINTATTSINSSFEVNGGGGDVKIKGSSVKVDSSSFTHNDTNIGDTHVHAQNNGNHYGGDVDTEQPH